MKQTDKKEFAKKNLHVVGVGVTPGSSVIGSSVVVVAAAVVVAAVVVVVGVVEVGMDVVEAT